MNSAEQDKSIGELLFSADDINTGLTVLARQLNADYKDRSIVVIALMNGALLFTADLIRLLHMPLELHTIKASSYHGTNVGDLHIDEIPAAMVQGKHVVIFDDVLDTAKTLTKVLSMVRSAEPASLATCVCFNKRLKRPDGLQADYAAFDIDDHFIVGYGLDYNGMYRELPYVAVYQGDV